MKDLERASQLVAALAEVYEVEGRVEATATAAALREGGGRNISIPAAHIGIEDEVRALLTSSAHPVARAALAADGLLPWGANPVAGQVSGSFDHIYAVCTLMGPEGPLLCPDLRCGFFYQRPDTYYALHSHLADETYVIVAGNALWTAGEDRRWRETGDVIHHPGLMPHAFKAGPRGLLAMWRWSGDIAVESYAMLDDPEGVSA